MAKERVGEKHLSRQGELFEIVAYRGAKDCDITNEKGDLLCRRYNDIKIGKFKNPYFPIVQGVGYIGVGKHKSYLETEVKNRAHNIWTAMFARCYSKNEQIKSPSYIGCSVDEQWHNFQNFAEWYEDNWKPYMDKTWQLDKDILQKGNKVYSPDNCCFVPNVLNSLLSKSKASRGNLPIGVVHTSSKEIFGASIMKYSKSYHIGHYKSIEEAFQAYKVAKESHIKEITNEWKGKLDSKVYDALMKYQVEITD